MNNNISFTFMINLINKNLIVNNNLQDSIKLNEIIMETQKNLKIKIRKISFNF